MSKKSKRKKQKKAPGVGAPAHGNRSGFAPDGRGGLGKQKPPGVWRPRHLA